MKISFLGATGTVTGSKYLLEFDNKRYLVDCGLFQGLKELRLRNWNPLPINPASLDGVLLTHAHIDHSGYIPLLVKNGFKGNIYATRATLDLCEILLPDSGHLQEEDARRANLYGYSKHQPALPLYTLLEAEHALKYFREVDFDTPLELAPNITACWQRAGHILGAASICLQFADQKLFFSGDMGRPVDPIMKPADPLPAVDYLVLESTYGDRLHESSNPEDDLEKIIKKTAKRGGTVLIPAFAVGRTQNILYYIHQLKQEKRIPDLPVYLDSPMAIDATELLLKHHQSHRLNPAQAKSICKAATYINSPEESKILDLSPEPKIIISASGMMTGGRILHHLKAYAPEPRNSIVMTGYQAAGTRGARLAAGEQEIKIHGGMVAVRAEIHQLNNASAHADYQEIVHWLQQQSRAPKKTFITHGEPAAAEALKAHIEKTLGWRCYIPRYQEKVDL